MGEELNESQVINTIMHHLYNGCTYKEIQEALGNKPEYTKGFIKKVIKKEKPELWNIIKDTKNLKEFRNATISD